jgi:hypothetical protein
MLLPYWIERPRSVYWNPMPLVLRRENPRIPIGSFCRNDHWRSLCRSQPRFHFWPSIDTAWLLEFLTRSEVDISLRIHASFRGFAQCRASWFTENAKSGLDTRARNSRLSTTSRNDTLFISLTSSAVRSSEHRSIRVFGTIGVVVGHADFIANRCSVSSM